MSKTKLTKNAFRRQQKKAKKEDASVPAETSTSAPDVQKDGLVDGTNSRSALQIDAPSHTSLDAFLPELDSNSQAFAEFQHVFERFEKPVIEPAADQRHGEQEMMWMDDYTSEEVEADQPKKSKKQRKRETKLSVAELKAMAKKPELVEWTDADSSDPRLLLSIKAHRNIVPVPTHWNLKREYLSSKRGVEKPPFSLPKFIADTGIAEMRDAALEKQAEQSLKQKQRERVQPKMGRLDIDYGKLYNAFFKFQTKPELTRFGEVYYEGKEFETNLKHLRPGELSDELKEALNMSLGYAPPWLLNMQRFGPPPSYPALRVPGVNAPPPHGAQWGFQPGGYGKPPVDDNNRPLYGGDIFGLAQARQTDAATELVDRSLWGELRAPEEDGEEDEGEEEEEDEEEEEEGADEDPEETVLNSEAAPGMHTQLPSDLGGVESVAGEFNLRKQRGFETEESTAPRQAYRVLEEQDTNISGFMGSDRRYNVHNGQASIPMLGSQDSKKRKADDVDVSLDLDLLQKSGKLSKGDITKHYEASREDQTKQWKVDQDDLSQMIAEESRKRMKKDQDKREERREGRR